VRELKNQCLGFARAKSFPLSNILIIIMATIRTFISKDSSKQPLVETNGLKEKDKTQLFEK